jgi:ActR/RegA family two-component response regulator
MTPPLALIIEDDDASAQALALIVSDWGAEVVHDRTGRAAEETLGARLAGLRWIITDFHLGDGEDGVSVVQRLARTATRARVLVLSGSVRGRANDLAVSLGYQVMQKPARAQDIVAWLEDE